MPQLDPSTFISQIFWLIITFLSLWFAMSWLIIPKIAAIIEERRLKIEDDVQKAESINKQALETLERYEKSLAKAKAEAANEIEQTKARVQAEIELKKAEVHQLLDEKISQNTRILATERAETMQAIDEVSSKAAALIIEKLGLTDLTQKDKKDTTLE